MKKIGIFLLITLIAVTSTFASPAEKQITLLLEDSTSGASSQAIVYFDVNLQTSYVYPQDSQIIFDTSYGSSQIYSFTSDGVPCYLNGAGSLSTSTVVPLGVRVDAGTYMISQSQISNFDPASMILLEDRQLGTLTNLRQHYYSVNISQSGRVDGRFFLHVSYPPQITDVPANCSNLNGTINIAEDSAVTWSSCLLYDSASQLVASVGSVTGNFSFPALNAGAYTLEFDYGNYVASKPFFLVGGQIILSISTSYIYAAAGQNINFSAQPTNADPSTYVWNFGDGNFDGGVANTSYAYQNNGLYVASFYCSNIYSCQAADSLTMHIAFDSILAIGSINANEVKISNDNKDVRIAISSNALQNNYTYEIDNLSGQSILNGPITSTDFIVATDNLSTGIYIVTVKNNNGRLTKKIFLP